MEELNMGLIVVVLVSVTLILIYSCIDKARLKSENKKLKETNDKVVSQRKSSEVRLGRIAENMAPFFSGWPYDANNFRFLGNPIDGIQFTDDSIIFIEIKSGGARLTQSQKVVKKLVKEGKIQFATFRINEDGSTLKMEDDTDNT